MRTNSVHYYFKRDGDFWIIQNINNKFNSQPFFERCNSFQLSKYDIYVYVVLYILKCSCVFSVLICTVNCLSVKLASYVQNFFTVAKLFIILVIVVAGIIMLAQGGTARSVMCL